MIIEAIREFAVELKKKNDLPGLTSPEDQLKGPLSKLLEQVGKHLKLEVLVRTEAHLSEYMVRPDIAAYVGGLIVGYIELKKPGLGA